MENYSFLFGIVPAKMFLAMVAFATVGVVMALLIDSTRRNKSSKSTPEKFSWKFLFVDNWKTILLAVLAVLLTLRFAPLLFPDQFTEENLNSPMGVEKWLFGSVLIGLFYNTLLQVWKQKADILKAKR